VIIRPARKFDATAIAAIYAPYVTGTVITFETEPPDAAEFARRMSAAPLLPWLVAEIDEVVTGYAYCAPHGARAGYRWSLDCGIYLAPDVRRQGVGRALYTRLFDEVRALGYVAVHAGIALPNAASVGLHESFGFEPVGVFSQVGYKRGEWHDVGWWQLRLAPAAAEPAEPRGWQAGS